MSDILLANPKLPEGWIDFSVGEAHIIKEALFKACDLKRSHLVHLTVDKKAEYPSPNGYAPLVKLLEDKYQAPVVVTNGAKQALGAAFYALHKMGKVKLGMRTPYWALIPPLAQMHGLQFVEKYDAYLAILPNNPDGFMFDYDYAKYMADYHRDLGIPFIHDAAYYTPVYLPKDYNLGPLGDLQIYSISKMYGLSGLRVGYVVCYNEEYYKTILEYMETMTVGVSTASQDICYNILRDLWGDPAKHNKFIQGARNKLYVAKALCKTLNKEVLDVPSDITSIPGMFLWAKIGPKCDFKKARINIVDGKLFGGEGMVRVNLGLPTETMIEAVERLNRL
jgi:aspartate/methionine/tyrosine aminotransferase